MTFAYKLILTVIGVALFSYIDNSRGAVTVASCVCGLSAFSVSELLIASIGNGFGNYFISAALTCLLAEIGARIMCTPVTVILLPAIIPLVPGALLYGAVRGLMLGSGEWYTEYGREALSAIAGIGAAIVSVSAFARVVYSLVYRVFLRIKHNKNRASQ